MREIKFRGEYITLGQLIKKAGFVDTGGEVKWFLMETSIKVNGEHDNRDMVETEGKEPLRLVAAEPGATVGAGEMPEDEE
jgi:hypothetical protein